jgi:hypothetical protein
MGRWAQASRTGGGPTALNFMREAFDLDTTTIRVQYNNPIGASSLTPASFSSTPSLLQPTTIFPVSAHTIDLAFAASIAADTALIYAGATPNIQSPQTIAH